MKKNNTQINILSILIINLLFISCKYNLIEPPTPEENKQPLITNTVIQAPENVVATHGNKGNIILTWNTVVGATGYKIYSKNTTSEDYKYKNSTKENTITLPYIPGTTQYFAISSVNFDENESPLSKTTIGSTLATPIITNIESPKAGNYTVKWWMDNCTSETYQDNIHFIIRAYQNQKIKEPSFTTTIAGTKTQIDLTLEGEEFYFEIEAKSTLDETQFEKSERTNAKSAKKISPNKVDDFSVSKGIFTDGVTLSWLLPDGVYKKTVTNFEKYPIYFEIYRLQINSKNTSFELLDTIGSMPTNKWDFSNNSKIHFNSETEKVTIGNVDCDYVKIEKSTFPSLNEPFSAYIPKSKIIYTDKTAERNKKYEYYIKSKTDNTIIDYADETSITETEQGYPTPVIELKVNPHYETKDDSPQVTKVTITTQLYSQNLSDYDSIYDYVLSYKKTNFSEENSSTEEPEQFLLFAKTAQEVENTFIINSENEGYYDYFLYIINDTNSKFETIPTEDKLIEITQGNLRVTVVQNLEKLPNFTNLQADDGYTNKIIFTWESITSENNKYTLSWTDINTKETGEIPINTSQIEKNGTSFSFIQKNIDPGVSRKYTLSATNTETKISYNAELQNTVYTLGKPNIEISEYDYENILVNWEKVPAANGDYKFSAKYTDDNSPIAVTKDNTDIIYDEDSQTYSCTLTKPSGYSDLTKAGKAITLTVESQSQKHNEEKLSSEKQVKLLGPAEIQKQLNAPTQTEIGFTWNKIEGAENYFVYRVMFKGTSNDVLNSDSFIIEKTDENSYTVNEVNGQETKNRTTCSFDSNSQKFTLKDVQQTAETSEGYQVNQAKIQTGNTVGYFVFPLKKGTVAGNCPIKMADNSLNFAQSSKIKYTSALSFTQNQRTSTYGYGINLKAEKAKSDKEIHITWEKPNNIENLSTYIFRKPFEKNRQQNPENWIRIATVPSGQNEFFDKVEQGSDHLAYMYAVQYNSDNPKFTMSYLNDLSIKDDNDEDSNKGYLYNIGGFKTELVGANDISNFTENIKIHESWDKQERAVMPQKFTIDIRNKNFANATWTPLAEVSINADGKFSIKPLTLSSDKDITVGSPSNSGIYTQPTSIVNKKAQETNGLLKVLRDTRHYYSLNITFADGTTVRQATDESVYTYRQITPTELAKCVNVIIADALYQTGIPKNESRRVLTGNNGNFWIKHKQTDDYSSWGFDDSKYQHIFKSGLPGDSNEFISDFIIQGGNSSEKKGIYNNKLYYLPELELTISQTSGLSSYNHKLTYKVGEEGPFLMISASKKSSLLIKFDGSELVNISKNDDEFKKWFPYNLADEKKSGISTVDTSLPIYNTPWWN